MSVQSVALASLTATYTDSEGEDGFDDELYKENAKTTTTTTSPATIHSASASPKPVVAPSSDVSVNVQRLLVSYHDDTVISDDEGGAPMTILSAPWPAENGGAATGVAPTAPSGESPPRPCLLSDDDQPDAYGVVIPSEPPGQCPADLQEKIAKLHQRMQSGGLDMNKVIQERKDFRNPSIYEKLIQFCSINELGTNYSPDRFDPFKWNKDSYYEELAKVQKAEMDKLEKARKEKTKCEIVSGTVKRSNSANTTEDEAKRRKSKWDQVPSGALAAVKPTVLLAHPTLSTLTASATGTKATVINAFGSMKKRL